MRNKVNFKISFKHSWRTIKLLLKINLMTPHEKKKYWGKKMRYKMECKLISRSTRLKLFEKFRERIYLTVDKN